MTLRGTTFAATMLVIGLSACSGSATPGADAPSPRATTTTTTTTTTATTTTTSPALPTPAHASENQVISSAPTTPPAPTSARISSAAAVPTTTLATVSARAEPPVTVTIVVTSSLASARPKGTVQFLSSRRLPNSQQDEYGCDRQVVTIANRSNTAVASVRVTFGTVYSAASADGMSMTGPSISGPSVILDAPAGIAPYGQAEIPFSPCVPSANSPYVFASPTGLTWSWE